jgi:hypothetical protein
LQPQVTQRWMAASCKLPADPKASPLLNSHCRLNVDNCAFLPQIFTVSTVTSYFWRMFFHLLHSLVADDWGNMSKISPFFFTSIHDDSINLLILRPFSLQSFGLINYLYSVWELIKWMILTLIFGW